VHLVGGKPRNRERAADGLRELFEGTAAPVYALRVERVALPAVPLLKRIRGHVPERAFEKAGLVPVPVSTGTGRQLALAWAAAWRAHIGPATLVAVRRDRVHEEAPFADPVAAAWLRTGDAEVDRRHLIT
jgi:hypothetical protein